MDKKSAIEEYCEACRRHAGIPERKGMTGYKLNEEHLKEQDYLLRTIRNQSRPQFGRDVLANIVGSASYDFILGVLKRIIR